MSRDHPRRSSWAMNRLKVHCREYLIVHKIFKLNWIPPIVCVLSIVQVFTFCILKHVLYRLHIDDYAEPHWNWKCLCVIPESLCYVYSMLHCIFASCSSCSWSLITDHTKLSLIFFLSPELPLYLFVNPLWSNWPLICQELASFVFFVCKSPLSNHYWLISWFIKSFGVCRVVCWWRLTGVDCDGAMYHIFHGVTGFL